MRIRLLIVLLSTISAAVGLVGCGTTVPQKSKLDPDNIKELDFYVLPSKISLIEDLNIARLNPVLSDSFDLLFESKLPIALKSDVKFNKFEIFDEDVRDNMDKQLFKIILDVEKKGRIKKYKPDSRLIEFLNLSDKQYLFVAYSKGFTREKGNFGWQVATDIGLGLLSKGRLIGIPIKANFTNVFYIIDIKNSNLAFYQRNSQELEPLKPNNVELKIDQILGGYFRKITY
ncbi:MAG: hypothetical protein LCH67_18340 [Bacteroidetes bacterium]|nr:hypothetical protein [Bacteroidota bacterium]